MSTQPTLATPLSDRQANPQSGAHKELPTGERLPRGLKKVIAVAFALLMAAILLELALRVVYHRSLDFSMEMWKYAVELKREVPNPNLRFVHKPNSHAFLMGHDVDISSQGLRDREYTLAKPPGVYRILMLGDSTTFGWGDAVEDTSSKILERELNSLNLPGYQKFEVINSGVGNYDTVQEVTYYETYGRYFNPDLVILNFFINDPEPVPSEKNIPLIERSYLVAYVTNRSDGVLRRIGTRPDWKTYYASLYNDNLPGYQACKAALRSLAASTQANNSKLLVALIPELHQINGAYPFTEAHQKIKNVMAAEQVPVVDLIEGLRNHGPEITLWVTPLDDHPNAKANSLIAAQLRDVIVDDLRSRNSAPRK
jgi:lysophospholipase L1-like esterase